MAVNSSYCRHVRVTNLMRRFPEALWLVGKIKDEAASGDSASAAGGMGATHPNNAMLSSAEELDVLLYIEAEAAHSRDQKQTLFFIQHGF